MVVITIIFMGFIYQLVTGGGHMVFSNLTQKSFGDASLILWVSTSTGNIISTIWRRMVY
jgi:hypothetical protein